MNVRPVNPYAYTKNTLAFNLQPARQNRVWRQDRVTFPVVSPSRFPGGDIACGELFRPLSNSRAPLTILVHGWGDRSAVPMQMMARALAGRGINSFVLYLPYHYRRLTRELKKQGSHLTMDEWFTGYQVTVTDIRHIIDWAETVSEINQRQIAIIGLSMGGFAGSIAMGIDPRISGGVFIVSGGNGGKIAQLSKFTTFRKEYHVPAAEYEQRQKNYLEYVAEVSERGWENVVPGEKSYLTDSLTYAYQLRNRPVLMINALWDEFIPREATLDFWEACGKCRLVWLPATHSTIWVWYPLILKQIHSFLEHTFSSPT